MEFWEKNGRVLRVYIFIYEARYVPDVMSRDFGKQSKKEESGNELTERR